MKPIIRARHVRFGYARQQPLFFDLDFDIDPGTWTAVAGPNGVGKTTLLNLLCGVLRPAAGVISLAGQSLHHLSDIERARKIAVVRQQTSTPFAFTVLETVMMARTAFLGWQGFERASDRDIVHEALHTTETLDLQHRVLSSLSGGERQRVWIARALAQATDILLLDEPSTFLDLRHKVYLYDLLHRIKAEHGKTVVTITHDLNLAAHYCDNMMLLSRDAAQSDDTDAFSTSTGGGVVCHTGAPDEILTADRIRDIFGVKVCVLEGSERKFFFPMGGSAGKKIGRDGTKR